MILIKDRHIFLLQASRRRNLGKYDTYKGSTPLTTTANTIPTGGKYDTYKGSTLGCYPSYTR